MMMELQPNRIQLAKVLSNNFVFRGVSREAIAGLAATAEVRDFKGGDTIVRQFERNSDLIILLSGMAKVHVMHGEDIAELGRGA